MTNSVTIDWICGVDNLESSGYTPRSLGVESTVVLFPALWRSLTQTSTVEAYIPAAVTILCTRLYHYKYFFLNDSHPDSVRGIPKQLYMYGNAIMSHWLCIINTGYWKTAFVHVSLMFKDVEHVFKYLFLVCFSSFENSLLSSLAHLLIHWYDFFV